MGRLFWKFFLAILLAQIIATIGIGGAFWLKNSSNERKGALDIDTSPPAQLAIDSAAATLEFGGTEALRNLLGNMQRYRVFAVDETGRDLLGRVVKQPMLVEARYLLGQAERRNSVRDMRAADGHRYLLFMPSLQHLNGLDGGRADGGPDGSPPLLSVIEEIEHGGPLRRGPYQNLRRQNLGAGGQAPSPNLPRGAAPFAPPGEMGGPPPDAFRDRFYSPFRPFIPLVTAALASLMCAFLLAWYFARPIRELRLAFEAASDGDLAPRFAANGKRGDELNDLGRDFDRMAARLRSLMDGQTRLLHDVSHELRSPLARLQAAIGLAHQQPEKVQASLERIERESVRMDKLVGELLTLSRLEAGALYAMGEEVNVTELLEEIAGDAEFEASALGRAVTLHGGGDALVLGQADLLARAIENVVRNAIKHSPVDGVVEMEMASLDDGRQLQIKVMDRGPGVAETDLKAIFEPFFRGGSTQKDIDGHGLGLAIAQHVIGAHGGAIAAHNRDGGGLTVAMTLPLKPAGAK